jgi:hypothetical protein
MENKEQGLNLQLPESSAANKDINIEISAEDFRVLKDAGYSLCIAKKLGDSYNVVWNASLNYLMFNTFSYTPIYQLFGITFFQSNVTVRASTNLQHCGLGETCMLNENGNLLPAVSGGSPTSLGFQNEYGSIHSGVNQLLTGIDGRMAVLPIYVSEYQMAKGMSDLTPKESVLVWFEQDIETSTMFVTDRPNAVELDLMNRSSITCLYRNGRWSLS